MAMSRGSVMRWGLLAAAARRRGLAGAAVGVGRAGFLERVLGHVGEGEGHHAHRPV